MINYRHVYLTVNIALLGLFTLISCKADKVQQKVSSALSEMAVTSSERASIDSSATTIATRFDPPQNFERASLDKESFGFYLRNFKLLDIDEKVHLYNGQLKGIQSVNASILDIDVGDKDLQQCADAVMRLRAEYLYQREEFDRIAFNFTNGWKFEYSRWRAGNKLHVAGNRTEWHSGTDARLSYEDFREYLDWVFMYAGTLSLSKELRPKKIVDMEVGDVFIYGGSPGHAVLVVDLAIDKSTGDKAFLLAQSYMPAQQIHILKNEENDDASPWYLLSEIGQTLNTPEWTFERESLKSF